MAALPQAPLVPPDDDRISWPTVFAYGAPGVGAGYMFLLLSLYVMKFSTDVLVIAPAVMGVIFSVSRVWDAVSDPLVGYLSDRTRTGMGRRRSWMLASVLPICAAFIALFSPPEHLGEVGLAVWMAVGVIGFYSAMTLFAVPHLSLGAELTTNYHERSRLFGLRHAAFTAGSILALVSMQIFINAEAHGPSAARGAAATVAWLASALMLVLIVVAVWKLRERREFQGRMHSRPYQAFGDVWRNPHARLLIVVTFIENVGSAAIGALTLYVAQYVVGRLDLAPLFILSYMIPSSISVPIWIPLARRFGKIRLWIFSMLLTGISFGAMFTLPFVPTEIGRIWVIVIAAIGAGLAAGCGGTVAPSIQGDVIDYDEYLTGERKEGSYFSAWNFVYKSASGVMLLLTGFVLQVSGFLPNQAQTMTVKVAMVALYGIFPLVCYAIGATMMLRFKLDETEHMRIRAELDARRYGKLPGP
jgi:GPH family glycoside/pentoside/hexuronide:cation symporter